MTAAGALHLTFGGELVHWRGPSPYHFVAVPEDACAAIRPIAREVTYGWGVIPATVRIGSTTFTTSLFPRHGGYLVPVKDAVRAAERLELGNVVVVDVVVGR